MEKLKLKVIVGSTREGRFGDKPAAWIFEQLKSKEGVEAEFLDLRDYPMPFFNDPVSPAYREGASPDPIAAKWEKKIEEADGFVLVTPEYNHGYSAVLKNAFDHVYHAWKRKPVAYVAYGSVGGARAVEQLRQVAVEVHMASVRDAVHIPAPWTMLEADGSLKAGSLEPFAHAAETMIADLIWWARTLKTGRSV